MDMQLEAPPEFFQSPKFPMHLAGETIEGRKLFSGKMATQVAIFDGQKVKNYFLVGNEFEIIDYLKHT